MASTLTGLIRKLVWSDYTKQPGGPLAGQFVDVASTNTKTSIAGISVNWVPKSKPDKYQLDDTLVVTAKFDDANFVLDWLFSQPQQLQDDLLNHEQGHYNIAALCCRDFFVDVMLLKGTTFNTAQAGLTAVDKLKKETFAKNQPIQSLYDKEVHPEQSRGISKGPIQQVWDRFFQTAFTDARASGTTAPDGTSHKVRLVDLLVQSGRAI